MSKKVIDYLEKREAEFRRKIGNAKKSGDKIAENYFSGHVHEIESLLFILKLQP